MAKTFCGTCMPILFQLMLYKRIAKERAASEPTRGISRIHVLLTGHPELLDDPHVRSYTADKDGDIIILMGSLNQMQLVLGKLAPKKQLQIESNIPSYR